MNIYQFASQLLKGENLDDKLFDVEIDSQFEVYNPENLVELPGRSNKIKFSQKQAKFPKGESVRDPEKMARAMHFFANHELLAIEMMAAAILVYPTENQNDLNFKLGLVSTIKDEQKHFNLYLKRMNELGVDFGDYPINNFFWKQMDKLKTPSQFYAMMALTFEAANLDFAHYYQQLFSKIGDEVSAEIMKIVYEDEIKHVSRGYVWLNKWKADKSLWQYYLDNLPELMTPSRAKGGVYDFDGRKRAGLPDDFIDNVFNYEDNFEITNRKTWKK